METTETTVKTVQKLMLRSYKRYQQGRIDSQTAYRENTMLANIIKAIEITEQEERIARVEATLNLLKD